MRGQRAKDGAAPEGGDKKITETTENTTEGCRAKEKLGKEGEAAHFERPEIEEEDEDHQC